MTSQRGSHIENTLPHLLLHDTKAKCNSLPFFLKIAQAWSMSASSSWFKDRVNSGSILLNPNVIQERLKYNVRLNSQAAYLITH
jgi:hypothetical protein